MKLPTEVLKRFAEGLQAATAAGEPEPTSMALATVDADGKASVRTVLLKEIDAGGMVFYTNTHSIKGRHLAQHPQAALCVLWKSVFQQVLVEGRTCLVSDEEADAYFASRPRGSQIGAWASLQSETLESRAVLEQRVDEYERQFAGKPVPRPPHWSGYRLTPDMVEFWYGREDRLHDRFRFTLEDGAWVKRRLYP